MSQKKTIYLIDYAESSGIGVLVQGAA